MALLPAGALAAVHHAAVTSSCNGMLGLCLFAGAVNFGTTHFNAERTGGVLPTVITLAVLCLVLPRFTTTTQGPDLSLNLALGSAMASIGLTIPPIAVASIWLDGPLYLVLSVQP